MATLTSAQVWRELDKQSFAVMSFVTGAGEPRSAGIVYAVVDRQVYFTTDTASWKARCLRAHPQAAVTVPIAKRIPFLPRIQVPAAVISFHGTTTVTTVDGIEPKVSTRLHSILRGMAGNPMLQSQTCVVAVAPVGDFLTYGVGVGLMDMRDPVKASGRAPVSEDGDPIAP